MATPRQPYKKVPHGWIEDMLAAGVSQGDALLMGRMMTHRSLRAVPGLLLMGPAGLAESLTGVTASGAERSLKRLERAGLVMLDRASRPPMIYIIGAAKADPPGHANSVAAMAKALSVIQNSHLRAVIVAEIESELQQIRPTATSKGETLFETWRKLTRPDSATAQGPESPTSHALNQGPESGPLRTPLSGDPLTSDPAAAYRRAWDRLPRPPFAAAFEDDLEKAQTEIAIEAFDDLTEALATSKWIDGVLQVPPTLRRLVSDGAYRDRIIAGEFRAPAIKWRCRDCGHTHRAHDVCPPKCEHCRQRHDSSLRCYAKAQAEEEAAMDVERAAWLSPEGETWEVFSERMGGGLKAALAKGEIDRARKAATTAGASEIGSAPAKRR